MDRRSPGRLLEADRRAREHLGVAERSPDLGRPGERVERRVRVPRPVACVAETQRHVGPLDRVPDAELERDVEAVLGLAEGERADRRVGGEQVVARRPARRRPPGAAAA